ncbi:MAG TPA: GAF domain-containing protein [Kofleriaceae bacterium]|nr:GAF domain-containing protein [Kofleriaceae bacterium]
MKLVDVPARCFHGVVPTIMATCAADGTPNVTYLSEVVRVDERHVALSCQFFNKTKRNVLENPHATIEMYDPASFEAYRLEIRFDHEEKAGPLFDAMRVRIDAIASHTGMSGVFKLKSADVYEVVGVELREGYLDGSGIDEPVASEVSDVRPRSEVRGIQLISQRVCSARTLDELLGTLLQALDDVLGFQHAMVLMPDETGGKLFVVASRGYEDTGVGAEVAVGEGLIGTVARERRMLRMSGVENELRYGRTIRAGVSRTRERGRLAPEIPLAGLADAQSTMALPLVANDRLVGVLAVESRARMAFEEWHEAFLEIVAGQVALAIDNVVLREREAEDEDDGPAPRPSQVGLETAKSLRYFAGEECVFVGDEYLIRNVPAKILWKLLREHQKGRTAFTNRELRVDPFIGLPPLRDNLESRLVLLRKRLEEKCPEIQLIPTGRGRFRLDVACALALEERA